MKKILLATALVVLAGAAVVTSFGIWWFKDEPREWTTRSPAALEEFRQGLEDSEKLYHVDASLHFERTLELDPGFVMAKLYLLRHTPGDRDRADELRQELLEAELTPLAPRERYLLEVFRARHEGEAAEVARLTDDFLEENPGDPYALSIRCNAAWAAEDWDRAERCFERLLDLHPNRALAQNLLGYIAMARGHFEQAEERFRTYRFIAPDQANPHDSLGQLLALVGRTEEAAESFEEAIRVKPDFCHSYVELAGLHLTSGDPEAAGQILDRLEEQGTCRWMVEGGSVCSRRAWIEYQRGRRAAAWEIFEDGCLEKLYGADPLAHRLALGLGLEDEAEEIETRLAERLGEMEGEKPKSATWYRSSLAHVRGVRHLAEGDLEAAVAAFRKADEAIEFWGPERASLKLLNLLHLRAALRGLGRTDEAERIAQRIREVHPGFLDRELPDLGPDGTFHREETGRSDAPASP